MALESTALFNALAGVTMLEYAGIAAGALQLIAYTDYYRKVVAGEVNPSPLSWLMFTYGTIFLLILELDAGATLSMIALPAACSLGSLLVAFNIWRKSYRASGKIWPDTWRLKRDEDGASFLLDLGLTACYLFAGALASINLWYILGADAPLSQYGREVATILILIFSNASTFPGFGPMIRAAKEDPNSEHWRPWALWTVAYLVLLGVTWAEAKVGRLPESINFLTWEIGYWKWLALMSYPASCVYLHARVSWLARPTAQKRHHETRLTVA